MPLYRNSKISVHVSCYKYLVEYMDFHPNNTSGQDVMCIPIYSIELLNDIESTCTKNCIHE